MSYEDYSEPDMEYQPSWSELFENCISPTLSQAFIFTSHLLMYNVVYTFNLHFFCTSEKRFHMLTTLTGLCFIYMCAFRFNEEAYHVLPLVYGAYILLHTFKTLNLNVGYCIGSVIVPVLIAYEFGYQNHAAWLKIKSVVMVAMMKVISLAFEMNDPKSKHQNIPSILEYSGYIWCPGNSVLGPWISYKDYVERFHKRPKLSLQWLISIFQYTVTALLFVVLSNCVVTYFITDSVNRYVLSFRDALIFRLSHYFISYLGSAAMVAAAFNSNEENNGKWKYTITNPIEIEVPRSLVSVVINWNIPTHTFLKKYIFAGFLPYGNFTAVLMTYLVSSMLHGLNIEVSMVLLSLGFFSFVQFKFQDVVASFINCCTRVRACRHCRHTNKYYMRPIFNFLFMATTVVYLAYTGCLMTTINHIANADEVFDSVVARWQGVNLYGHYLALASVFLTCILT